jgi:protein-disulfide isomerase
MRCLLLLLPSLLLSAQTSAPINKSASPTAAKAAPAPVVAAHNFKESGSPAAPVQIEIYTDYECPACRDLYLNTLPSLSKEYVQTGKVRLLHRDFPLQQHQFSRIATRYANAAGEMGKYDLVANQIFVTQSEWAQNGNLDAVLSKVLSPADLKKVSEMAKSSDTKIDESVNTDVAMGNRDNLRQTPTIVIISKGKREVIAGALPFSILKSYIDKKLAQ